MNSTREAILEDLNSRVKSLPGKAIIEGFLTEKETTLVELPNVVEISTVADFKNALSKAKTNTEYVIKEGEYTLGEVHCTIKGKASSLIRFIAEGNVVIKNSSINFENCEFLEFIGFTIQDLKVDWGVGLCFRGCSKNITIRNIEIQNLGYMSKESGINPLIILGTSSNPTTNILIDNCYIHDCDTGYCEAIALDGNITNSIVKNCTIDNTGNIGIDLQGNYSWVLDEVPDNEKKSFVNQARQCKVFNNVVMTCQSKYAKSAGIYLDGSRENKVYNNLVYNSQCGIEVGAEESGADMYTNDVFNNYILNCGIGVKVGGYLDASAIVRDIRVFGNSIFTRKGFEENVALSLEKVKNLEFTNNVIYLDSDGVYLDNIGNSTFVDKGNSIISTNVDIFEEAPAPIVLTLQEQIDKAGDNFTLDRDYVVDDILVLNKDFTLTLNGFSIICKGDFLSIEGSNTVSLTDTKNGSIICNKGDFIKTKDTEKPTIVLQGVNIMKNKQLQNSFGNCSLRISGCNIA